MFKRTVLFLVFFISTLGFFQTGTVYSAQQPKEITVSAAISLKNAFIEIGKIYEAGHKGTRVLFNFGASGDLARQIEEGAPVDAFASAAEKDMDYAGSHGLILPGSRIDFAANTLVLIVPNGSKAGLASFKGLESPSVQRIAVGNPKSVPAGRYAEEVFRSFGLLDRISGKLIYTENVRQALDYVARGEVDAGVVYSTDAAVMGKAVTVAAVAPANSHKPIVYPMAVVKASKNGAYARAFVSLVTSKAGMEILQKYGFKPTAHKK